MTPCWCLLLRTVRCCYCLDIAGGGISGLKLHVGSVGCSMSGCSHCEGCVRLRILCGTAYWDFSPWSFLLSSQAILFTTTYSSIIFVSSLMSSLQQPYPRPLHNGHINFHFFLLAYLSSHWDIWQSFLHLHLNDLNNFYSDCAVSIFTSAGTDRAY